MKKNQYILFALLFFFASAFPSVAQTITTFAGGADVHFGGDGGPATSALFNNPIGVTVDAVGNIYVADAGNNRIRKIDLSGNISTLAGNGTAGFSGDGGPATSASLDNPISVAVDAAGNVYVSDNNNNRIRKIDNAGIITTFLGSSVHSYSGDGGPASAATINIPGFITLDASGNLYIADGGNNRIRKVNSSGVISTVAGNGTSGFSGDGGPATSAQLYVPSGVAVDATGNLYISDCYNYRIRKVDLSGNISTVVGNGTSVYSGDGGPATAASINLTQCVTVDGTGNIYIADDLSKRVRKVSTSGTITTIVGNGFFGYNGDGISATSASLWNPIATAVDAAGNIFITDPGSGRIRKVNSASIISTIAGTIFLGDGGPATSAALHLPKDICFDAAGNVYISEIGQHRIRKVSPGGIITTFAGNGSLGFSGDGGAATSAQLNGPTGLAADADGNIYVADVSNGRIRKINNSGTISTIAGDGLPTFTLGEGGPALNATVNTHYIDIDGFGNIYLTDASTLPRVRKINTSGVITTIGGTGTSGYSGDGGLATSAQLGSLEGISVDIAGNVFVSDYVHNVVRKINSSGIISTVAGNGSSTYSGDGGPATSAGFKMLMTACPAHGGNLIICDYQDRRIRLVNNSGIITTIAGNGTSGYSGDGGSATSAQLGGPVIAKSDPAGNLYIVDYTNNVVRKVTGLPYPVNIDQPKRISGTIVAPNPAHGTLTLNSDDQIQTVAIVDAAGNTVLKQTHNADHLQLDISRYPLGIYFAVINGTEVHKFV